MKMLKMGFLVATILVVGLVVPLQAGAATQGTSYEQSFNVTTNGGIAFSFGINATWSWTATSKAVSAMRNLSCVGKHSTLYTIASISCTAKAGPNDSVIVTDTMTEVSPTICLPGVCVPQIHHSITDVRQVMPPNRVFIISQSV